ncbi:transcription termination factor 2, mitochondrial [Megalops cyprinoides]|uniref:transcription termination factor 2, mitochondrial n=1 Tax=Megalops cyprinoides TaxID=118141 RepID=UPI0018643EB3|nr:transcription termination factor 2, mitochondrial [Megalops cyprinoides]XP_036376283.1 transcription termination factor 2, mitochondrial [Megalops cyprinoides]XP_036376284.1 transcription termination factor 2, mitochondrial [Megalops cyprinoides]
MLRVATASLCVYCRRAQSYPLASRGRCSTPGPGLEENKLTVDALYDLSVDIRKIRKLKGWVLRQSPAYVQETAALLRDLGADGAVIARVLEQHPEAVLCRPEQVRAQQELWTSVCPNNRDLVGIIEKFPASFFTVHHHGNQKANIQYFQSLRLNKRIIGKLMASAPQSFSHPVERNREVVSTLEEAYLSLGGEQANMKIWLQKLLSQNPFVLMKPPAAIRENLAFLRERGFSSTELLRLISKLRGFFSELSTDSMRDTLAYSQEVLRCSEEELRETVLKCPALLYFPVPVLADRFKGLLSAGVSMAQIRDTPTVLELTTQIVLYRIQKLRSYGYDVRTGSLEALNGTKKDFEMSHGRLQLRQERPLFNPVAPLKASEE